MLCSKCGHEIQKNHLYCRNCGAIPSLTNDGSLQSSTVGGFTNSTAVASVTTTTTTTTTNHVIPELSTQQQSSTTPPIMMSMNRQDDMLQERRTFNLIAPNTNQKIVEDEYCCCPLIPCGVCVCASLEVVPMANSREPVKVTYDPETRQLQNVKRHRQVILNDYGESQYETQVSSWGCICMDCCTKEYKWDVMEDGTIFLNRETKYVNKDDGSVPSKVVIGSGIYKDEDESKLVPVLIAPEDNRKMRFDLSNA